MNTKQIKSLFPIKAMITQEIIDNAEKMSGTKCFGALTLKSVLPSELHQSIVWLNKSGLILKDSEKVCETQDFFITTEEEVSFMLVDEPQEVTFIFVGGNISFDKIN